MKKMQNTVDRIKLSFKKLPIWFKVVIIISIIIFIGFFPYISLKEPFLFNPDQQLQYNYFYKEWIEMINKFLETGSFPFFSFNTFLGSNFYASKAYYVTGDIFLPFLRLFSNLDYGLMIETFILIQLSGVGFSLFLKKFGIKNENIILFCSIIYAFSGLAEMYVGQYMFHRFYAFLPFLFYGVELYRVNKKLFVFSFFTFILFLSSYYFMFPTSLFLVLYFFFTYSFHENKFEILKYFKKSLPLIFAYLVGLFLSAFLILPAFFEVLNNQRLGDTGYMGLFYELPVYIGYIFSYITAPFNVFTNIPYMFAIGFNGHLTWYSLSSSILVAPAVFSIFFVNRERKDKSIIILLCLLLLFILFPPLSSIFHGFSEPSFRWIFVMLFVNLLICAIVLDSFNTRLNSVKKGAILYTILFIGLFILGIYTGAIYPQECLWHVLVSALSLLMMWCFVFFLDKQFNKVLLVSGCVCLFFYFISLSILNIYYTFPPKLINTEAMHFNESKDEDLFYRININPTVLYPFSELNLNQSINLDYKSVYTYDSTYEGNLSEFLALNGMNWHIVEITNPEVLKMLGVKYFYVQDESELPDSFEFEYFTNIDFLKVYKLLDYRKIGFTYNKFRTELNIEKAKNGSIINHDLDWNNELLINESLFGKVSKINPNHESISFNLIGYYDENNLYGSIENKSDTMLFMSIPYNKGWKVYDNGMPVDTYSVQGGFIGVYLESGIHNLKFVFTPQGFKEGILISGLGFILTVGLIIRDILIERNSKRKAI